MKHLISVLTLCTLLLANPSCKKNEEPIVEFQTTEGIIKIKLYKETPQHRDNFIKLVEDGYYNNLIFHKALKDYLIQTGNPKSKDASPNRSLGDEGPGYTIPAEINYPQHFHKRGCLSAVRLPDTDNPNKASNGSQFCIIQGRVFTNSDLDTIEMDAYNRQLDILWQRLVAKNRGLIDAISLRGTEKQLKALQDSLVTVAEKEMKKEKVFFFTPEQRKSYTSVGGVPYMDKEYSIFGEVIEGLDVVEKIASSAVDAHKRPKSDVRILSAKVVE